MRIEFQAAAEPPLSTTFPWGTPPISRLEASSQSSAVYSKEEARKEFERFISNLDLPETRET